MYDYVYVDNLLLPRVRRIKGMGSPAPRRDVSLRASRHGATDRTLYYDGRVLDIEALIVGETELDAWQTFDEIEGALQLGSAHTLRFRRTGFPEDEQCEVSVASPVDDGISWEEPRLIRWGVSLFAADPRIYGATLRSGEYDPSASLSGGGLTLPLTFPLTFSSTTASNLELVNSGNMPTPPIITVRGPVVNPIVDNDTLAKSIFLLYSLGSSDTIQVDVSARTIKLNGAERLDLLDAQNTEWWELAAGTNRLRLRGAGMATDQTLLTVQYRDARI